MLVELENTQFIDTTILFLFTDEELVSRYKDTACASNGDGWFSDRRYS